MNRRGFLKSVAAALAALFLTVPDISGRTQGRKIYVDAWDGERWQVFDRWDGDSVLNTPADRRWRIREVNPFQPVIVTTSVAGGHNGQSR